MQVQYAHRVLPEAIAVAVEIMSRFRHPANTKLALPYPPGKWVSHFRWLSDVRFSQGFRRRALSKTDISPLFLTKLRFDTHQGRFEPIIRT